MLIGVNTLMIKDKKISPVYEKGYPSYETVNREEFFGPEPVPDCEGEWIVKFDFDTYSGGVEYFGQKKSK